jgi:hypothetical protein
LEAAIPPSPSSSYAMEGTSAHECAARILMGQADYWSLLGTKVEDVIVTPEMLGAVSLYIDACRDATEGAEVAIERTKQMPFLGKGRSGTSDFSAMNFDTRHGTMLDYKHGAGVYVHHIDNPQFFAYGSALLDLWRKSKRPDPLTIYLGLAQPRFDNAMPIRGQTVTPDELDLWRYKTLPAAIAVSEQPDAPLIAGEHCRFCAAKPVCSTFMSADKPLRGVYRGPKMKFMAVTGEVSWLNPKGT